jgi:hypothetical protein
MSDDTDEKPKRNDVGYGRPPKEHQFRKGVCPNPAGRRGKGTKKASKVAEVLSEPITVRQGGVERKMDPFEASARGLIKNAVAKRNVSAAIEFIRLCEQYQVIKMEANQRCGGVLRIPRSWDEAEWMEMFRQYGAPPWPGERSGLPESEAPLRSGANDNTPKSDEKGRQERRARRGSSSDPHERKRIIERIAHEERTVSLDGKLQKRATIDLVLITLRERAAEGNVRASRTIHNLLEKYGSQGSGVGAFLILPEPGSEEEYYKMLDEHQAKYRGNQGEKA